MRNRRFTAIDGRQPALRRAERPRVEPFEERSLLATITVNTAADQNDPADTRLSLREAIEVSNGTRPLTTLSPPALAQISGPLSNPNTIVFEIPVGGTDLATIMPTSPLPAITAPVIIDGYTQPGAKPNTLPNGDDAVLTVALNGAVAGAGANGLVLSAGQSTVRGLAIGGFVSLPLVSIPPPDPGGSAIELNTAGGDTIEGDFLGTTPTGASAQANGFAGVYVVSSTNTIGGATPDARNVISGNTGAGVYGFGSNNDLVEGNFIGTDAAGANPLGNNRYGVALTGSSVITGSTIGGTSAAARNVIAASGQGVFLTNSRDIVVEGNFIGTDVTGTHALGNTAQGIFDTGGDTIGGTASGAGNLISGNNGIGLFLFGAHDLVEGNFIGTDVTGTHALANQGGGLDIQDASNTTIGGSTPGSGNVISGNTGAGLTLSHATFNLIEGNLIGTDNTGTAPVGNTRDGLFLVQAAMNTIGGTAPGSGNVIAANGANGIEFQSAGAPPVVGNVTQGNFIGADATGTRNLGNARDGVVFADSFAETLGGENAGAGNLIAFNHRDGVSVVITSNTSSRGAGTQNAILGNVIFANTGLGIDLGADGVTPNTPGGPHAGPNDLQNHPVLTQASAGAGGTAIQGTLNSIPSTTFTVEFFANQSADPSGFGQGQSFLGSVRATTDAAGNASLTFNSGRDLVNQVISATDTDPNGNTSEFGQDRTVSSAVSLTVVSVKRYGIHAEPTILLLTFSAALDPARATDTSLYQIVTLGGHGRGGRLVARPIPVRAAVYDPTTLAVTLYPSERLDIHNAYQLKVIGTPPSGLTGASGQPLSGNGSPGTDYVHTIDRHRLAGTAHDFFLMRHSRSATRARWPRGSIHAWPRSLPT
jgi:CSLREA domain-containing protein